MNYSTRQCAWTNIETSAMPIRHGTKMSARRKQEWFDDDTFWQELYPFMFSGQRFAGTAERVEKVLALTRPRGKVALDLCCGPGRYSIALAQAGFTVTGVDRTSYLLNKARAKARAAEVAIPLAWFSRARRQSAFRLNRYPE